jgi:hypothetical protein
MPGQGRSRIEKVAGMTLAVTRDAAPPIDVGLLCAFALHELLDQVLKHPDAALKHVNRFHGITHLGLRGNVIAEFWTRSAFPGRSLWRPM